MTLITRINRRIRMKNSFTTMISIVLIITLGWLSNNYILQIDITTSASNTLSLDSQKALNALPDPIRITAYIEKGQSIRSQISQLVNLYKEKKSNLTLSFIDPQLNPEVTQAIDTDSEGIILIEYQSRIEKLDYIDEDSLTKSFLKLANIDSQSVNIQPKTNSGMTLDLSDSQISLMNFVNLLILPLLFLITGFIIWHKRKAA